MHPYHPKKLFALPSDWSGEQALAVLDLLDELREHIAAKYGVAIIEAYRTSYAPDLFEAEGASTIDGEDGDLPAAG